MPISAKTILEIEAETKKKAEDTKAAAAEIKNKAENAKGLLGAVPTSLSIPKIPKPNIPKPDLPKIPRPTLPEIDIKTKVKAEKVKISLQGLRGFKAKDILNAAPTSLKLTGTKKIPKLILNLGIQIATLFLPQALSLLQKLDICPTDAKLKGIIEARNGITSSLNGVSKTLGTLTKVIDGINKIISTLTGVITTIQTTKTAVSAAAKAVPLIPGAIPATLSDLGDLINKLTFSATGKATIENYKSIVASASLSISMVNNYILQIVTVLNSVDSKIKACNKYVSNDLLPISPDLIKIADQQKQAEKTQNNITYNGFIIEIEKVPYTPTVDRKRAVGKNQDNITLIQTPLSFTTDDQILIEELKLIIDRDSLKAY